MAFVRVPNLKQLKLVAQAFGLQGEFSGNAKFVDRFGPLVFCTTDPVAFITRVTNDRLRCNGSVIADSDGTTFSWPNDWQKRPCEPRPKNKLVFDPVLSQEEKEHVRYFKLHDATYVAIANKGIPERVFLFPGEYGFDTEFVISRLKQYSQKPKRSISATRSISISKY